MPLGGYKVREPGSLKEAVGLLVYMCGGASRASEMMPGRVSGSQINRYTEDSEANATMHMPVDVVRCLERACGTPVVTSYLAMAARSLLVALPGAGREHGYLESLGEIGEETGDLFRTITGALADGKVEPGEAAEMKARALQLATGLAVLVARLDRVIDSKQSEQVAP